MSAPLRIEKTRQVAVSSDRGNDEKVKFYFEKLLKLIPAEAQTLFGLHTIISPTDRFSRNLWIAFCFIVIIVVRVVGTSDQKTSTPPDWIHVGISCVAFALWLMSLGMLFPELQQSRPYVAILLMAAFTFIVPYIYKKA